MNPILYFSVFTISEYCYGYLDNLQCAENKHTSLKDFSIRLEMSINSLKIVADEAFREEKYNREYELMELASDEMNSEESYEDEFRNAMGDDMDLFLINKD